ncbi:MAG: molybdate ABC transporter substrate-binding protein [Spirochaetes bacterium]|nr:molybdate ABC transporter substrate-binding protein [Spirochaetota bacterium]
MNNRKCLIFLLLAVMPLNTCQKKQDNSLLIMCGTANKLPVQEIARIYEKEKGIKVHLSFGGSGSLLSQIELTKKGDIYLPGSPDYILKGIKKNLILKGTEKIVSYLILGIVVPVSNPANIRSISDLTNRGVKIGIGNPETVAIGLYTIEFLIKNHLLDKIFSNIVTYGSSGAKTVNLVILKKVDAIICWRVFSRWHPDKLKYIPIPEKMLPRLSFVPVAVPVYTKNRHRSEDFINFLTSETGKKIYKKYGYITSLKEAKQLAPHARIGGEYILPEEYFRLIRK